MRLRAELYIAAGKSETDCVFFIHPFLQGDLKMSHHNKDSPQRGPVAIRLSVVSVGPQESPCKVSVLILKPGP